jgi:hypothetical protein
MIGARDDLCNAAAGALVMVAGDAAAPALWRPSTFTTAELSDRTYLIFAVVTQDDTGQLAAIFFAKTSERHWAAGVPPLTVLDAQTSTLSDLRKFAAGVNDRINDFLDLATGPRPACAIMAPETPPQTRPRLGSFAANPYKHDPRLAGPGPEGRRLPRQRSGPADPARRRAGASPPLQRPRRMAQRRR